MSSINKRSIKQAQAEGIAEAKKKGKHLGRPQMNLNTLTPRQRNILDANYKRWKNNELSAVEFMKQLDLKKNTFYKIAGEYGESTELKKSRTHLTKSPAFFKYARHGR